MEAPRVRQQRAGRGASANGCEEDGKKVCKGWEDAGAGGVKVGSGGQEGEGDAHEGEGFGIEEVLGEGRKGWNCLLGDNRF